MTIQTDRGIENGMWMHADVKKTDIQYSTSVKF